MLCLYHSFLLTLPLLQRESLPRDAVLQEQASPAWFPHGVIGPASKPAPARAFHRVTASFGHLPALVWGPPQAAGVSVLYHGPPWIIDSGDLVLKPFQNKVYAFIYFRSLEIGIQQFQKSSINPSLYSCFS